MYEITSKNIEQSRPILKLENSCNTEKTFILEGVKRSIFFMLL